jgi:glycosyltransferase involved in cell wall biosynthesis
MRIDVVSPYWRPVTGGVEDHVSSLVDAAVAAGHSVRVHTLNEDLEGRLLPLQDRIGQVEVRRYKPARRIGYYTTRFEPKLDGDVVHLHAYGLWTHDWIVKHYPDRPKVMTLHHGLRIPTSSWIHRLYHWWHRRTRGRRTLNAMHRVVAVTQLDAERLRASRYDMKKVVVIPNGVPASAFEELEAEAPPSPWRQYFLYVGRLHKEKSVEDAIKAMFHAPPFVGLLIAGPDHGERERLETIVKRGGFSDRVRFLGRVEEERKRALLRGATALVLPSWYEAQGRVIVEAWAQGTPAVASAVGGVPYIVKAGSDGLLYPWGDVGALEAHIRRLADHPEIAKQLGRAGLAKARAEFREEELMARTLALYDEVRSRPAAV